MPDYKEMYYKLFKASQAAVELIIAAQRECEEIYISDETPEKRLVPFPAETCKGKEREEQA